MISSAPIIFDRELVRARQRRAARLAASNFLVDRAAEDLSDRLAAVLRRFECAADVGTPSEAVHRALAASGKVGTIIAVDRSPAALHGGAAAEGAYLVVAADEEALPFRDASLDLVVSALALQFVNDLPGTLIQIRRALKPDGLLLAALVGGDTLIELRQAFAAAEVEIEDGVSPRVAPFSDVRDMGALLQRAGFALPVADSRRFDVSYPDALALMRDLRAMGETNVMRERLRRPLRRELLARAAAVYAERFGLHDGRVRASFDVIFLTGWAPAPEQPRPLRPGSARARLADALGTIERSAGEPAGGG